MTLKLILLCYVVRAFCKVLEKFYLIGYKLLKIYVLYLLVNCLFLQFLGYLYCALNGSYVIM
jgi:hypothetical protein